MDRLGRYIPTRIESDTVVARWESALVNMEHPIAGNSVAHRWKWVFKKTKWNVSVFLHSLYLEYRTYEFVPRDLRPSLVKHEPPGVSKDGSATNIRAHDKVSEEEPLADQRLGRVSRRGSHDGMVGSVEAQGGGGQSISDQVDPQELDRDQRFGHTEEDGEEDPKKRTKLRRQSKWTL